MSTGKVAQRFLGVLILAVAGSVVSGAVAPLFGETMSMLWSVEQIRLRDEMADDAAPVVSALAVRAAGDLLATAGDDHVVRVWNARGGGMVHEFRGHADWVRSLVYSPQGDLLASAGNDRRVMVWGMEDGSARQLAELPMAIADLDWSERHDLIAAVGFAETLVLFDAQSGRVAQRLACPCRDMRAVAFSPDGSLIAAGGRDGVIRVWDVLTKEVQRDYTVHRGRIRDLVWGGPQQTLISCGEDRRVHLHTIAGTPSDDQAIELPLRPTKILALAIWGDRLAVGGSDNEIRLWDLATRQELSVLKGHQGSISCLAATPEMLISGSYDTTVRLWTPTTEVSTRP